MAIDVKYRTRATAKGGRDGHAKSDDGTLDLRLVVPKELGGPGGDGVDPEKLFAAGYAACLLAALRIVASQQNISLPTDATVKTEIGIGPRGDGGFGITASLMVTLPGLHHDTVANLVEKAHFVCPYSHATRNNLDVVTVIE